MSQGADITSPEVLKGLCTALKNFSDHGQEILSAARRNIEYKLNTLQDRCDERRRELARCKQAYAEADPEEDDMRHLAARIEESQDELREAKRWLRRTQEAYEDYQRNAQRFADLIINQSDRAIVFLRQRQKELEDYLALRMDGDSAAPERFPSESRQSILTGPEQPAANADSSTLNTADDVLGRLIEAPLPQSFHWICLNQLSERAINELPGDDEYRQVSKEIIRQGLEFLRQEILPAIEQDPTVDSFYFEQSDRQASRDPAMGARSAYDAFFGSECIVVDPTLDGTRLDITNGRHRIRIAQESGWSVIPAKIIGRN
jgi:hypothetical protein